MAVTDEQIKQWLHTLGMRCYVNCFEAAWKTNGVLTTDEIIKHDPDVGVADGALNVRKSILKTIFQEGAQMDVLLECTEMENDAHNTAKKAKRLYDEYCKAR